jgi:hypothetical protein
MRRARQKETEYIRGLSLRVYVAKAARAESAEQVQRRLSTAILLVVLESGERVSQGYCGGNLLRMAGCCRYGSMSREIWRG